MASADFRIRDVSSGYGEMTVLHGIDLDVPAGSSLGVIGPNGAGKTTLLRALAGTLPATGSVTLGEVDFTPMPAHERVANGLAMVPEGRQIIGGLSVQANLDITMLSRGRYRADAEHELRLGGVHELFPLLRNRSAQTASSLSGGEQQMLAFGRALMTRPSVLLVDEPSQGLAPQIVDQVGDVLTRLRGTVTLVVVEQNRKLLERVADDVVSIRFGRLEQATTSEAP